MEVKTTRLRVVAESVGQSAQLTALQAAHEEIEVLVVVPAVAPLLARSSEFELRPLFFLGLRIQMGRGEEDVGAVRAEEGAGRLADAGTDEVALTTLKVEPEDLVERIALDSLALEDHVEVVRRPVAFAGAASLEGESPRALEEIRLVSPCRGRPE
jgi:hypothetical protein